MTELGRLRASLPNKSGVNRYVQHLEEHEAKRRQFGLPKRDEHPCDPCDHGEKILTKQNG